MGKEIELKDIKLSKQKKLKPYIDKSSYADGPWKKEHDFYKFFCNAEDLECWCIIFRSPLLGAFFYAIGFNLDNYDLFKKIPKDSMLRTQYYITYNFNSSEHYGIPSPDQNIPSGNYIWFITDIRGDELAPVVASKVVNGEIILENPNRRKYETI